MVNGNRILRAPIFRRESVKPLTSPGLIYPQNPHFPSPESCGARPRRPPLLRPRRRAQPPEDHGLRPENSEIFYQQVNWKHEQQ